MGKNGWSTRPVGIDLWEFDQMSLRRFKKIKKYWIVVFYELKAHMVLFHWRGYKVQSRRKPGQISWNKAKCSAVTHVTRINMEVFIDLQTSVLLHI